MHISYAAGKGQASAFALNCMVIGPDWLTTSTANNIGNLDILDVKIPSNCKNTGITGIIGIEIFVQYQPILLADTNTKNSQN